VNNIVNLVLIALAVSAISITLTRGKIFRKQRLAIRKHSEWLYNLLSCPYCTSHWISLLALLPLPLAHLLDVYHNVAFDFALTLFVVIAMAAVISGTILRLIPFGPDDATDYKKKFETLQGMYNHLEEANHALTKKMQQQSQALEAAREHLIQLKQTSIVKEE
jgi:hypothetical protein